jgi:hypothetical protein
VAIVNLDSLFKLGQKLCKWHRHSTPKGRNGSSLILSLVKDVPVNYAIRSSGPVTALTARRVWYGVGAPSICQADPSGKVIKL